MEASIWEPPSIENQEIKKGIKKDHCTVINNKLRALMNKLKNTMLEARWKKYMEKE